MSDKLRRAARAAFDAAVARADPAEAVRAALEGRDLSGPVTLLGLGKAGSLMAEAALPFIDDLTRAVVVTTREAAKPLEGVETIHGGHPVPDEGSIKGGKALLDAARAAEGTVLVLVSGGGSALAVAPPEGVSLADKTAMADLLLTSGADITQMNAVRSAVSELKAGGLARACAPARVVSLILSDVPGDRIPVIASGPTSTEAPDPARALEVLDALGLTDRAPEAILAHLRGTEAPPPAEADNHVIGSNELSVDAAEAHLAESREVVRLDGWLDGDVAEVAERLWDEIRRLAAKGTPVALVAGGETTVKVTGQGKGGRNQEMAMRVAMLSEGSDLGTPWVFLSGGTDGRDGPTEAAGGLVDAGTCARMRDAGIDPDARLADNDANPALDAAGDLLVTGQTGTNVADVQIALVG